MEGLKSAFFSLLFAGLDTLLFFETPSIAYYLAAHAFIVPALYYFEAPLLRYSLLSLLFLGPFGAVSIVLFLLIKSLMRSEDNLLKVLNPESVVDETIDLWERLKFGFDDLSKEKIPLPFEDVLQIGSEHEKRIAIEKCLRYFQPQFAHHLRKALQDPSPSVRVLAATALSTVGENQMRLYLEYEDAMRLNPESVEAKCRFARHAGNFARAEVLDPDRKEKLVTTALDTWNEVEQSRPLLDDEKLEIAGLYLMQGEPEKVLLRLAEDNVEFRHLKMEAAYQLQRYDQVREFGGIWKPA